MKVDKYELTIILDIVKTTGITFNKSHLCHTSHLEGHQGHRCVFEGVDQGPVSVEGQL